MSAFLALLPSRIDQAITGRSVRAVRVWLLRRRTAQTRSPQPENRRLFVDLTIISRHDAGTGIQRVVRALALALLSDPAVDWQICFVAARKKQRYCQIAWPDRTAGIPAQDINARPGDVFLGLDYALDAVRRHRRQLAQFRKDGGALWFLIHDLLPLQRPDWFSRNTVIRYKAWLAVLAGMADGFLCNSEQTEIELKDTLADRYGLSSGYRTRVLPMGHSILDNTANPDAPREGALRFDASLPFVAMIGTLEPRKGHADAIAAFGELWRRGERVRLVIVGRVGWKVDALTDRICRHPEFGDKLLWFDDIDDTELSAIYQACTGVIVASHAEGFGLPLIEALGHGKPVLARDLPVFRTQDGSGVRYFPVLASTAQIAREIEQWLLAVRAGAIVVTQPEHSWREATRTLLAAIASEVGKTHARAAGVLAG